MPFAFRRHAVSSDRIWIASGRPNGSAHRFDGLSHGFVATVMQLVNHVLQPLLGAVTIFTEFVVKNWTVGLVYLAIVVYAIIRKFKQPVP